MEVNLPLKIIGHGRYLPKRVVSNAEVEALCGLSAGWVERRNGVRERRWVTDETSSFMSAEAAREALDEAKLRPDQLDLIINASGTGEQAIPDTGSLIQSSLANNAMRRHQSWLLADTHHCFYRAKSSMQCCAAIRPSFGTCCQTRSITYVALDRLVSNFSSFLIAYQSCCSGCVLSSIQRAK